MDYNERNYLIFPVDQLSTINFDEVLESSEETVRRSVDGTKTFVKWEGTMPPSVSALTNTEGPYTHSEILEILSGVEWTAPMEEMI